MKRWPAIRTVHTALAPALRRLAGPTIVVALAVCSHERASDPTLAHDTGAREARSVELGPWTTRPAEGGGSAVFAGDRTIAVGRGHAVLWQGDRRIASLDARAASPGGARVFDGRVAWGPNVLALDTRALDLIAGAVPEPMPMGRGDVATAYAWSGDGAWLARSTSGSESGVQVTLHRGGTGERVAVLHRATAGGPQALWLGPGWVALGLDRPRVVDLAGEPIAAVEFAGGTFSRFEASRDERWLIAVDLNRAIGLIDTRDWTLVDRWVGPWADASIPPSGHAVAALELGGTLRVARASAAGLEPLETLATIERANTVQLADDAIAVVGGAGSCITPPCGSASPSPPAPSPPASALPIAARRRAPPLSSGATCSYASQATPTASSIASTRS